MMTHPAIGSGNPGIDKDEAASSSLIENVDTASLMT
jgi:hypothetical protein